MDDRESAYSLTIGEIYMKNYDRCGFYKCCGFKTSIPTDAAGTTLFKAYLTRIGHSEGVGLTEYGSTPRLYTIDKNSEAQNTEMKDSDDFDTLLIGIREDENWNIYELNKCILGEKRNVITYKHVEKYVKDGKGRQVENV